MNEDDQDENFETKIKRIYNDTKNYIVEHKKEIILLCIACLLILLPIEKYSNNKKYNKKQSGGDGEEGQQQEQPQEQEHSKPGTEDHQQKGQKTSPKNPTSNSILSKIQSYTIKIGEAITRVITVIMGIFLVFGLITLPFILYAVAFYFVIKKGVAVASKL